MLKGSNILQKKKSEINSRTSCRIQCSSSSTIEPWNRDSEIHFNKNLIPIEFNEKQYPRYRFTVC